MRDLNHKLVAAVTTGAMMSISFEAFALGNLNLSSITRNIGDSAAGLPKLISTVAYICGLGLSVGGIMKLKEHVDKPEKKPLKNAVVRLAAGGGLLTLPYVTKAMQGSVGDESSGVGLQEVDVGTGS